MIDVARLVQHALENGYPEVLEMSAEQLATELYLLSSETMSLTYAQVLCAVEAYYDTKESI